MSRQSRFDKLEGEREGGEAAASSGASLERFAAEPEMSARAEPVDPMAPEHGAERLQRFEADGSDGLGLDRDPLAALPMLECVACKTACGKFEGVCHSCRTSLTSPEARAHNLARAEARNAERALSQAQNREKLRVQLDEAEQTAAQERAAQLGMARELGAKFSGSPDPSGATWGWWLAIAAFFGLFLLSSRFGFKVLFFSLAAVCLMTRVPRAVWLKLGQQARGRRFW